VVYEWLSGDRPFHGSFTEIAVQHSITPPPSLREKVPTILPDVEQVVMTALAKEPKVRFMSVQAFAKALEQASQADVVTFVKPPPLVVQPVPAGTNVVTSKPLAPRLKSEENNILTLTQFLLVIKGTWGLSHQQAKNLLQVKTLDGMNLHEALERLQHIMAEKSPTSVVPSQKPQKAERPKPAQRLSSSSKQPAADIKSIGTNIYINRPGTPRPGVGDADIKPIGTVIYRGHSDYVRAVMWSPDGKRIASGSSDTTVQVWDAANGGHMYTYVGIPSILCLLWHGRPMASALPRGAIMGRCRCGMPPLAARCIPIMGIPSILCLLWHGRPMGSASPRAAVIGRFRYGRRYEDWGDYRAITPQRDRILRTIVKASSADCRNSANPADSVLPPRRSRRG
jgi:eukaryotic-like serine/threonine-protein kinase